MTPNDAITYNLVARNKQCANNPTLALLFAFGGKNPELKSKKLRDLSEDEYQAELKKRVVDALPFPDAAAALGRLSGALPRHTSPATISACSTLIQESNLEVADAQMAALTSTELSFNHLPTLPAGLLLGPQLDYSFMWRQEDDWWEVARKNLIRQMATVELDLQSLANRSARELAYHLTIVAMAQAQVHAMRPQLEPLRFKFLNAIEAALVTELGAFGKMNYESGIFSFDNDSGDVNFDVSFVAEGEAIIIKTPAQTLGKMDWSLRCVSLN